MSDSDVSEFSESDVSSDEISCDEEDEAPKKKKIAVNDNSDKQPTSPKPRKKKTVEETYQKLEQREHILQRPDMYVGSVQKTEEKQWIYDEEKEAMVYKTIEYVPALYKIFDEILVNAADNYQRDENTDTIKVDINKETGVISVYNNGQGIPVKIHEKHGLFVPELIFGHLLTGSNFDDTEQKVTGGRNGLGAKLANIYSLEFKVETASGDYGKKFAMTWYDNMTRSDEPKITPTKDRKENWTRVTFKPDLKRFGMQVLEDDMIALMKRRVWDIAGCNSSIKVYLNKQRIPIKSFTEYVKLYFKDRPDLPIAFEKITDDSGRRRWEVAVTLSDGEAKAVSFVNSIATTRGGTHVTYIQKKLTDYLQPIIKKKNRGAEVKAHMIKNYLWIFVNALLNNPEFDSQTKETLKSKVSSWGTKCDFSEAFLKKVSKTGIVEMVLQTAQVKGHKELEKTSGRKKTRLTGIAKLDDANNAGGKKATQCTLILTEGDSAKALAVSGLGIVGRDDYGVFPLRGKLLNVRDATHNQIMGNEEITALKQILGLQHGKDYQDTKSLRYGHIMIMADQDHDGSHIKGLIINFIHYFWPSLLRVPGFMTEFITPIVKATKGKQTLKFYTMVEYERWKQNTNTRGWKIRYYKGLGSNTPEEAQEYFSQISKHQKEFQWTGPQDDEAIEMAFSKKKADARKEWLRAYQPGTYLDQSVSKISYSDFINKELILFSLADCVRSIPSMVDGLKPGQRKILFCCFKRNLKTEIKVAQLSGYVSEHSAYHHGEASLHETIIGMAQNYVGAHNINLLEPIGQFGTRLQGGEDAASARYIRTKLADLTRYIFIPEDDHILKYLEEDGESIEPEWYVPIIPMVLVNGNEGIGTGWSSKIPNYNPRDIIENLKRLLKGDPIQPMHPWYRGFKGTIEWDADNSRYNVKGVWRRIDDNTLEITELPIRVWTQTYKEFLEKNLVSDEKSENALVQSYKEYHTDTLVHFVIKCNKLKDMSDAEVEKAFKLVRTFTKSNMHVFDAEGRIKKFDTPEAIVEEFFHLRLKFYQKRKDWLAEQLTQEHKKLKNQVRFIQMVINKELIVSNRKKDELIEEMFQKGFDSIPKNGKMSEPTKSTKGKDEKSDIEHESELENDSEDESESKSKSEVDESEELDADKDFDYLLSMPIWSLTLERAKKLEAQLKEKENELSELLATPPEKFWERDLDHLLEQWEIFVNKMDERDNRVSKGPKKGKSASVASRKRKKTDSDDDDDFEFSLKKPKSKAKSKSEVTTAATLKSESQTTRLPEPKESKLSTQQQIPEVFSKVSLTKLQTIKENGDKLSNNKKENNKIEKNRETVAAKKAKSHRGRCF
jgi:DNA topoisomerase-2